jgi:hypothetical protein
MPIWLQILFGAGVVSMLFVIAVSLSEIVVELKNLNRKGK